MAEAAKAAAVPVSQQLGLPAKREELMRKIKQQRTLNDLVEEIFVQIYTDTDFQRLIAATIDAQALEGSLACDNTLAALKLREKAQELHYDEVVQEKLESIKQSLGVVLRRYGLSRKERKNKIGDVVVDTNGSTDE
jgi:hypothetical protein